MFSLAIGKNKNQQIAISNEGDVWAADSAVVLAKKTSGFPFSALRPQMSNGLFLCFL